MLRHIGLFLFLLASLCWNTGCASIAHPGPDKVALTSTPAGATVKLDGMVLGQTPLTASIGRQSRNLSFSLPGYDDSNIPVARKFNGWVVGNILFGGLVGIVVDSATGNSLEAEPRMHIDLRQNSSSRGNGSDPNVASIMSSESPKASTLIHAEP